MVKYTNEFIYSAAESLVFTFITTQNIQKLSHHISANRFYFSVSPREDNETNGRAVFSLTQFTPGLELIVRRAQSESTFAQYKLYRAHNVLVISIAKSLYGSFMGRVFARWCPPISVSVVDSFALPPVLKYLLGLERRRTLDWIARRLSVSSAASHFAECAAPDV